MKNHKNVNKNVKRKFRHLKHDDHLRLEVMLQHNVHKTKIAEELGVSLKTVYNEINKFSYIHKNSDWTEEKRYSCDMSDIYHDNEKHKRGCKSKLLEAPKLVEFLRHLILNEKYSPYAALQEVKKSRVKFECELKSVNTIYRAIDNGLFAGMTREVLPHQRKRLKKKKKEVNKQAKSLPKGTSIEKRPFYILNRLDFGHWEMDTVIGQKNNKKSILVFTERKTRMAIFLTLKRHTTDEVRKALNRLEKAFKSDFYRIFKSITVDNGAEFKDFEAIEKALYRKGKRTKVFYCHPYAPHERGSNENNNILLRRWIKKGMNFDKLLSKNLVKFTQDWVNNYPRKIFNGKSSMELFIEEMRNIQCNLPLILAA